MPIGIKQQLLTMELSSLKQSTRTKESEKHCSLPEVPPIVTLGSAHLLIRLSLQRFPLDRTQYLLSAARTPSIVTRWYLSSISMEWFCGTPLRVRFMNDTRAWPS